MRFSIHTITSADWKLLVIRDEVTGTEVKILPESGAMLHSFSVQNNRNEKINVIDHYQNKAALEDGALRTYKSARLSPFVCRIPDGKYRYGQHEFEFKNRFSDGSAIHGLLVTKPFTVSREEEQQEQASATMSCSYRKDDPGYPFDYTCTVIYTLKENNMLRLQATVRNDDRQVIPIADGWHPYFTLGEQVGDWLLQFNASAMLEFNEKLIPTGRLIPDHRFEKPAPIGETFLDNCFLLDSSAQQPACRLQNPHTGLTLSIRPDNSYPYLQIFTPPARKSIAIENLSSAPDCFNNRMGLLLLEPGRSKSFSVQYELDIR
jgi:aldose 1-epimerase